MSKPLSVSPPAADAAALGAATPGVHSRRPVSAFFQALPVSAWTRIGLLLVSLSVVKLVLLLSFSKHLYEIHWRVTEEPESWLNYAAFLVYVALGVFGLLSLATACRQKGLKTVRAANGAALCLGLLFIFFTFHTGDKNYLYPILTRTLKWSSLVPYLSLDLFFRPPYLAAWLLGYAFVYYLLSRTRREIWALHLTALVAGAYALLCLRELHYFPDELMVIDALGLASLFVCLSTPPGRLLKNPQNAAWGHAAYRISSQSDMPCRPGAPTGRIFLWLIVPCLWAALYCLLLARVAPQIAELDLYFRLLLGGTILIFAGAAFWAKRRGFLIAWIHLAPFGFGSFLLFANSYYPMARNYDNSLCLALEFPHYFLGELSLALIVAGCVWAYYRLNPKTGFRWLDVINLVLIAIALVDLRLSQIMGVRLEWDVLSFSNSPKMMWRMARPYLPSMVLGLGAVVLLYELALHAIQRGLHRRAGHLGNARKQTSLAALVAPPDTSTPSPGFVFAICSFLLLGISGWVTAEPDKAQGESALRLAASSPLWGRATSHTLSPEEFVKTAADLGLGVGDRGSEPPIAGQPRDLNLLVVFMESSYNKYLSLFGSQYDTQPLLAKYKDRMEVFPNFFSDFASSIHARFATFTSLYPVRDYNAFTLHPVKVKSLFEVLHERGYSCSLFYSSFFDYTGFGDFLKGRGIDELYDANNMPGARGAEGVSWGLKEETTLAAMRRQIKTYAQDKRQFFLTYVPAAPHYPYDNIPKEFRKYKKEVMNDYTPVYLNELLYMDWVLASIVDQLRDSGVLDHTLVIITNDHGEMLGGEGDTIGHGWAFTPELANTPLIVMDPEHPGWHVNYTIGSQVDFLPTVLDRLNLPLPSGQLYQGRSLYRQQDYQQRLTYLNTCQQFGVLHGDRISIGDRDTEGKRGAGTKPASFTISNEGTKTIFTQTSSKETYPISIRAFDAFQENFLRNYSSYCQALCKSNSSGPGRSHETASTRIRAARE